MTIAHKINDLLFELFPAADKDTEKLLKTIKRYYTVGPFEPEVKLDEEWIYIEIDVERIDADKRKYDELVKLAEGGNFKEAVSYAEELIKETPNISEYYRIHGQVLSDMDNYEEAINSLIDALKWNPKNEFALLMMGNIFAKHKNDIDTALTYYDQVLEMNPDDYLALNNIGATLFENDQKKEARKYLEKALEINPDSPQTLFALAMLNRSEGSIQEAFNYAVRSLKKNKNKDNLYAQSSHFALDTAQSIIKDFDTSEIVQNFINELTVKTDTDIKMQSDSSIKTAATIQYAEVHNRNFHLILYKPDSPAVDHLILHELMHLEFAHEARECNSQKLFTSNSSTKATFLSKFEKESNKLIKSGLPEMQVKKMFESMYVGLNSQIFNTPIDLFIEDRIFNRYETLRPLQFVSLFSMLRQGIEANTRPDIIKITPSKILSSSIVYNLVNSIHFKELFGVDLIAKHKPKKSELEKAQKFYKEFQEYRDDKKPGEEYDLIQFWAEDLRLDKYFELIDEESRGKTAESVLDDIENDPYSLEESDPSKEREMKIFLEEHGSADTNVAVAMYMVDALQFFEGMPKEEIKKIAFEIAHIGTMGIDPKKDGYKIPSIPKSNFSGYKTLAYYYVSWALAVPEMLSKLQMPFDEEFKLAKQLKGL